MKLKMTVEEAKKFLMKECDDVIILSHDEGEGLDVSLSTLYGDEKSFPITAIIGLLKYIALVNNIPFAAALSGLLYAIVFGSTRFHEEINNMEFIDMIDAISAYLHDGKDTNFEARAEGKV